MNITSGVLLRNNKVLLVLLKDSQEYAGYWSIPAGLSLKSENDNDTLRRVLFEALEIQVINAERLTQFFDNEKTVTHSVFQVVDWRGDAQSLAGRQQLYRDIGWFEFDALPSPLTPATKGIANSYLCQD